MKYWSLFLAAVLALASVDADAARRLGGGQSIGRQSPNVTQREAGQAPAQPAAPGAAQKSQAQQPAAAAPAQTPARRGFGGMLAGLAAGLGLAWLAHALGFGEGFAIFLMVALLAVVAMAVIGAIMRSRSAARQGGYAFEGAGAGPDSALPPRQYNPYKVGNDASARPWERGAAAPSEPGRLAPASGVRIGSALEGRQGWGVPAGFDTEGFVAAAKRNFVTLQDAWDRGDVTTLRSMMTDEMLGEIRNQLAERQAQGGQQGRTEVEMLEAQLLGIEELDGEYMASVEFSGMIREEPSAGPSPFREVWNMVKPKSGGSGWLVAGVQALQ
jgi:predicted lipid-binding transport protein (Tim44 family)